MLESDHFQGRVLDSTSHGYRRVISLPLRLEELRKQQEMPMHLHAHFAGRYMVDVEVFEPLCHVDSCAVISTKSSCLTSYSPRNWLAMSFESPYASRFLTPISSAICIPIKIALYYAILLEHGSVNENA